jgi:hypothetical protein
MKHLNYLYPLTFFNRKALTLLAALLIGDLIIIGLYCLRALGVLGNLLSDPKFSLVNENGYGEYFQYSKFFFIVVSLAFIFLYSREKIYLGWLLLFSYLLLDDSLQIHETIGAFLAESLHLPTVVGIRPVDFGEIFVSLFFGGLFLSIIGLSYRKAGTLARQVSVILFGLMILLGVCGVGMDVVHSMTDHYFGNTWVQHIPILLEDGGEHFTVSSMMAFTFAVALRYSTKPEKQQAPVENSQTLV